MYTVLSSFPQGRFFTATGVIPLVLDNRGKENKTKTGSSSVLSLYQASPPKAARLLWGMTWEERTHVQTKGCEQKEWKQLPAEII